MRAFPVPPGRFIGELVCDLRIHYGAKVHVADDFQFFDGEEYWCVPKGFIHDGASFPWWLRWVPALVGLALHGWWGVDGYLAAMITVILQGFVGWPLEALVREAAAVHDFGYKDGRRPKWKCDRAFFYALWQRIYLNLEAERIGVVKAWLQLGRAFIWTGFVFFCGFVAWWGHRWRQRKGVSYV